MKCERIRGKQIKNALAGNRTRVYSLGGYNSTSKLLVLLVPFLVPSFKPVLIIKISTFKSKKTSFLLSNLQTQPIDSWLRIKHEGSS